MTLIDKYKSKIRKLLALAESDNPHEAERARVQAEKLMRKHNLMATDVEVVSLEGKAFTRRHPKDSENCLIWRICEIAACESFPRTTSVQLGRQYKYQTRPVFMGLQHDAEMAVYCWEVLLMQMQSKQRAMKKEYGLRANDVEIYSCSWAIKATEKLVNVFGTREVPKSVASAKERMQFDGESKPRSAKSGDDPERESALHTLGYRHGEDAYLNVAASDLSSKQARLASHAR